jgi:hypothetical protein
LAENAPRRELTIERVDGESVLNSPVRSLLEQAGFKREYLGLTLRLPALSHPQAARLPRGAERNVGSA